MVHWVFVLGVVVDIQGLTGEDSETAGKEAYFNMKVRVSGGGEAMVSVIVPSWMRSRVAWLRPRDPVLVKGTFAPDAPPFSLQGTSHWTRGGKPAVHYVVIAREIIRVGRV